MNSKINRSFSPFQESGESRIDDDYWFRLPSRSGLLWRDVLKKRLAVILGEAGDTLKDQLVGQYLKGRNSRHGILVLLRLDKKRWQIPDGVNDGQFEDLVKYLRSQATQIKAQNDKVERLEVFGINCAGL